MRSGLRVHFDPAKDAANVEKHGLSLALAGAVIENATATFIDDRYDYGEERFVTFGYVEERLCVAVWTERDGVARDQRAPGQYKRTEEVWVESRSRRKALTTIRTGRKAV